MRPNSFTSLLALTWILGLMTLGLAQPTAKIVVEAYSPQEIHDLGWTSHPSTGLDVIGKGELVYLGGYEAEGQEITTYSWSIVQAPEGSTAELDSTDTQQTTFRPDLTGQFVVQLSITTSGGMADTMATVTSAEYVGVGSIGGETPNTGIGQCGLCHSTQDGEWHGTGHSTMFSEAIDGIRSDHYNEGCIECHTLGFNEEPEAVNGGFDDVAADLGWVFPAVLQPGNWDDILTNYAELAQKSNIQCENCHGPGSLHRGDKTKIDVTLDEGVCGRCHEEEPYHRRNAQWKNSRHAIGVASAAGNSSCAPCHSGYGFIKSVDPGNNLEQSTGFPQVSCQVCHDPHSAELPHQVRKLDDVTLNNGEVITEGGMGKLCMNCHLSRRDAEEYAGEYHGHYGPHHSNQTDMLFGRNAIFFGLPYLPSSPHQALENACVTCHMSVTPAEGEPGRDFLGEHSFAMHWDGGTPEDPADDIDHVAVCQPCHGAIASFDDIKAKKDHDGDGNIGSVREELSGLLDKVGMLLPPEGDPLVEVTPEYNSVQLKAAYNYFFVTDDGSRGIHNFQFAVHLLKLAYEALNDGVLTAAKIEGIDDVPNDQGKQVRMAWERFGGDGISDTPIQFYAMWRRVDDAAAAVAGKAVTLDKVSADMDAGTLLSAADGLWDFVGSVPAAGMMAYSAVVPTLYDSTAAGTHWSVFMVSGHTAIPALFVASEPDSGYSVDNLAPAVPANITGTVTPEGDVLLSWNKAAEKDFNYFAVYRSTTPQFDPSAMEPYATTIDSAFLDTEVQLNQTYYYVLSAFDYSGNESAFSAELPVVVTAIAGSDNTAIPTDYVLQQNYPNPFNPSTAIRFGVPAQSEVKLVVYNVLGKRVRTLLANRMTPGFHTVVWDGRDDHGNLVSAGVYLYRLESESTSLTSKMLFIK